MPADRSALPGPDERDGDSGGFREAAGKSEPGFFREFWDFLRHNKKWWLLPIFFILLLLGVLVFIGGTSLSTFLYPLF